LKNAFLKSCRGSASTVSARTATLAVDSTGAVLAALLAGAGFAILPDFMVKQDLAAGRLVHALPQWLLPDGGIHAVFPSARFRAPKVAVFIELLSSMIKGAERK
jgi:DNA-binding transcriptional LysR family regulator